MGTGSDDEIARAFDTQAPALLLYARQWVSASAAEDVIQKVFLNMIASRKIPIDFRPWLYRCVRNEAISVAKSHRRRERRESSQARDELFLPSPESAIDTADAQRALASLSPVQREVVTLRIWSELTLAEISRITGTPISTLQDHFKAALAAMKQILESPCRTR